VQQLLQLERFGYSKNASGFASKASAKTKSTACVAEGVRDEILTCHSESS
jgi:hypothetical protein